MPRWRDSDAAPGLHQPRWRKLLAPLELGSRLLEGLEPPLSVSFGAAVVLLRRLGCPPPASTQPLHCLPPPPGPQRLMETPLHSSIASPNQCPPNCGQRAKVQCCGAPRGGRGGESHIDGGASLLFIVYTYVFGARHGAVHFPRFHVKMKVRPLSSRPSGC